MIPTSRIKKVHFIGIGGAGMSGIAEILHRSGFVVTGSDARESEIIEYLRELGIQIAIGHSEDLVKTAELIVYSSAIPESNPEREYGKKFGIPVIRRAEMLGELMRLKYTLAVSGTHGKTTTTSMLGHIWNEAGLEPTIIVGGIVRGMGSGAQHGEGQALIAEADEYDRSFLQMVPSMAIITNIEEDHLDCYSDFNDIRMAFIEFANKVPFYGQVIACIDDEGVRDVLPEITKSIVTYGFSAQADYRAENVVVEDGRCKFDVFQRGELLGNVEMSIPGRHNIQNALSALALAMEENLSFEIVAEALKSFKGVRRRFEFRGLYKGARVFDDYAHHPTEVGATLNAAREFFPGKRLVAVFQPHLYSRTRDHYEQFASAFLDGDVVCIQDVFGAREQPIAGITGEMIVNAARERGHRQVEFTPDFESTKVFLDSTLEEGDVVLCLGAGSIWRLPDFLNVEEKD